MGVKDELEEQKQKSMHLYLLLQVRSSAMDMPVMIDGEYVR